jgi:prolyl-tRNA editing enzyme YbaK/EbsC (Cys-tRNA(Pro) deacylase)
MKIDKLNDVGLIQKALEMRQSGMFVSDIAKTLSFHVGDEIIVVVMSGDARIDNKKYKEYFGTKAKMLSFEEVEPLTGHPVGGVCPFGLNDNVKVYLDESLKILEYVYPAAGAFNCALKIKPSEMAELTNATWIDVCEIRQN